jgi:hypothetical protein
VFAEPGGATGWYGLRTMDAALQIVKTSIDLPKNNFEDLPMSAIGMKRTSSITALIS